MKSINIIIQFVLLYGTVIVASSFLLGKKNRSYHKLIAAKYDPEMPKPVREILVKVGDNSITKIQLGRTPVQAFITHFLNFISGGKFNSKQIELGYDEIYHNYLLITIFDEQSPQVLQKMFDIGQNIVATSVYKLEKAQRIRLVKPKFPDEFADVYNIPLTPNKTLTLNRLITTASNVDKDFYKYDAANNNMCQTFVENIVNINDLTSNIIDNVTYTALKPQDARALIATLGSRSDFVKKITDLAGKIDKLVYDHKIKWKKPVEKHFMLYGDMHIRQLNDTQQKNDSQEIVINGMADVIIENSDDVYNAVVALEQNETKFKTINLIVFGILSFILLVVLIIAALVYRWRRKKHGFNEQEIMNSNTKNYNEESSEISETTNN